MNESLLNAISMRLEQFKGASVSKLFADFNIASTAKSKYEMLISKMLKVEGKVNKNDIFVNNHIIFKTVRKNRNDRVAESMSLPSFRFDEICSQEWEESSLFTTFKENVFVFMVFKEDRVDNIFEKFIFWRVSDKILNGPIFETWTKAKEVVLSGNIIKEAKENLGKITLVSNFPGISFNGVCHVRPHARNANDTNPLPFADKKTGLTDYTKQCFWLNSSFLEELVK